MLPGGKINNITESKIYVEEVLHCCYLPVDAHCGQQGA